MCTEAHSGAAPCDSFGMKTSVCQPSPSQMLWSTVASGSEARFSRSA